MVTHWTFVAEQKVKRYSKGNHKRNEQNNDLWDGGERKSQKQLSKTNKVES